MKQAGEYRMMAPRCNSGQTARDEKLPSAPRVFTTFLHPQENCTLPDTSCNTSIDRLQLTLNPSSTSSSEEHPPCDSTAAMMAGLIEVNLDGPLSLSNVPWFATRFE